MPNTEALDRVQQFLYDLNVELDYDYADPDRDLFPELAPHYAQLAWLPLAERVVTAFRAIKGTSKGREFAAIVARALVRAANVALGKNRTLTLLDIAHDVCPEALSNNLWQSLLFRQKEDEAAEWLGSLALRFERWQINVALPRKDWQRAFRDVAPNGFETLVRWALSQAPASDPAFRQWVFAQAKVRLSRDHSDFHRAEVDIVETESRLHAVLEQLDEAPALDASSAEAAKELRRLRAQLVADVGASDGDPGFWRQGHGESFPEFDDLAAQP